MGKSNSGKTVKLGLVAGCFLTGVLGIAAFVSAHAVVALTPGNLRWHAPNKSVTATFLGKDQKETAVLDLKKAAVLNTEISIQSDATTINLVSGDSVRLSFTVLTTADGATTRLKLGGGDQPVLLINDKDEPRLRGKWIEVASAKDRNLTIELENTTFATVTFDQKSVEASDTPNPGSTGGERPNPSGTGHGGASAELSGAGEMLQTITPAQLKVAADAFASGVSHRCLKCSGRGKVTVSVQYGTRQDGRIITPLYRDETQQCDRCKGSGKLRASDEILNRLAGNFLKSLSAVKRDDPKTQDAISDSYKMITDVMIGDYKTWLLLTENGRSILSQQSPTVGTPVIAKCLVKKLLPREHDTRDFLVEIGGTNKVVRISEPVSADEVKSGPALAGGVLAGHEATGMIVLNHGFLVAPPIEKGWWWWYWWRPGR
jgi:hypothetical protein